MNCSCLVYGQPSLFQVLCEATKPHIMRLLQVQKHLQLILNFKLTEASITPNAFQKMNVRLAAVLLSNRTTMALNIYRTMKAISDKEKEVQDVFQGKTYCFQ